MPLPTDPLLAQQWHLGNTGGQLDLNVQDVWDPFQGPAYTGAGIRVVVVDDGFDYTHTDLAATYDTGLDFDWDANNNGDGTNDFDPFGQPTNANGTAVAGIIAADNNGTGAVGVAFDASIVGYRVHNVINDGWLLDFRDSIHHSAVTTLASITTIGQSISADTASEFGIGYNAARFDEIETSIDTAVDTGRSGLGTTIVKAAGNARADNYDVNADDWANDTRQVVVAAVDQDGFVSSYSSYGAAILVSGFGTPGQVVTTDRVGAAGFDATDFTSTFNGTAAAAAMVSGVVALMYDANSELGWRDVQTILAVSARHVGSDIGAAAAGDERHTWQWNAADNWNGGSMHFSNDYGYGLVDARAAVRLAETWLEGSTAQRSSNEFTNTMDMLNAPTVIPDGNATGLTFTGDAPFDDLVERVTVQMTFSTTFTGDLEIYLISPDGTVGELIKDSGGSTDFNGTWTFETQAFRGERAAGNWSVRVVDDAGGDVLSVSDIVVRTFGVAGANDRYVFTDEYATFGGVVGHNTISDTNGGTDQLNASAVTGNSIINLTPGSVSTIAGKSLTIAVATNIENAFGGDGNDTIVGNELVNLLAGGRGNDTYYVDNAGDTIVEGADQGTLDHVLAAASYALGAAAQVEALTTTNSSGTGAINLTGNGFAQTMFGNAGANVLNGGGGADTMTGFGGNDIYVTNGGDIIVESAGGGADIVQSYVSYALGANLEHLLLLGGAAINGTGNGLDNNITGNSAANLINGLGGADNLFGGGGDDIYVVDNAGDTIIENAGGGNDIVQSSVTHTLGANVENLLLTGSAAINGFGNGLANRITGNSGNNTLNGGGEADFLFGGAGNDIYVTDGGDTIFENAGGGSDIVQSSVTHTLGANVENLLLTGSAAVNGFGNGLANRITGNSGNNTLNGGGGADFLFGGAGDDIYVTDGGDTIVENSGGGADIVQSSVTNILGANLEHLLLLGGAAINGTGNGLNNNLIGNSAANTLNGMGGADNMYGAGGNDIYVTDGGDTIIENAGAGIDIVQSSAFHVLAANVEHLLLTGGAAVNGIGNGLANNITGNSAANLINGVGGSDNLFGGGGSDTFVFNTPLGAGNVDRVMDYSVAADQVMLGANVFMALAPGVLAAGAFRANATGTAADASDRIIYETDTGALFYDADGAGGAAGVLFGNLGAGLAVTNADFLVV